MHVVNLNHQLKDCININLYLNVFIPIFSHEKHIDVPNWSSDFKTVLYQILSPITDSNYPQWCENDRSI